MSHRGVRCLRVCTCTCCACILPLTSPKPMPLLSTSLVGVVVALKYTEIFRSNPDSKPLLSDRGHLYSSAASARGRLENSRTCVETQVSHSFTLNSCIVPSLYVRPLFPVKACLVVSSTRSFCHPGNQKKKKATPPW